MNTKALLLLLLAGCTTHPIGPPAPPMPRKMLSTPPERLREASFVTVRSWLIVPIKNGETLHLSADFVNWTAITASVPVGATLELHCDTSVGKLFLYTK